MRNLLTVFLSFVTGIVVALVLTSHPSPVRAQFDNPLGDALVPIVPSINSAVPRVFPLRNIKLDHNLVVGGGPRILRLDGLQYTNNMLASNSETTILYGGGAYQLDHVAFGGKVRFQFDGAAANTIGLLASLGILKAEGNIIETTIPTEKNKPIATTGIVRKQVTGDISSQYDGK